MKRNEIVKNRIACPPASRAAPIPSRSVAPVKEKVACGSCGYKYPYDVRKAFPKSCPYCGSLKQVR